MSDFDKEAERERLREKYESEREDREATQHMSELLLKGATMTNAHCGNCGDPIFRHDGQEFCPTCNNQVNADATQEAATAQTDGTTRETAAARTDAATAQETATARNDDAATQETPTTHTDDGATRETTASTRQNDAGRTTTPAQGQARGADANGQSRPPTRNVDAREMPEPDASDAAPGANAVANVEATVERFAAAAANTDDPERAREYLAAVRDATDTLHALRSGQ